MAFLEVSNVIFKILLHFQFYIVLIFIRFFEKDTNKRDSY